MQRKRLPPIADPVVWWIAVFVITSIIALNDRLKQQEKKLTRIEKDAAEVKESVDWLRDTLKKGLGQ